MTYAGTQSHRAIFRIRPILPLAILSTSLALGLSACGKNEAPAAAAAATPDIPYRPTSSLQDLMMSIVDPSADEVWESVAVISTEKGVEERHPRTDEDWAKVRAHAVTLVEAANLLMIPGRRVAAEGKKLQDEGVEGVLGAAEVQALIDKDHTVFAAKALALHDTAMAALKAIDDKNVAALAEAGGPIDEACEGCHTVYWYPNSPLPPPVAAPPAAGSE
jgi:hypothetical protein